MKPVAKKGLMIVGVLYVLTVGVMVASFVRGARPKYPEEVAERLQERLEEVRQWAYERDREHIRQRPIAEQDAATVVDLLARPGMIINVNYTLIIQCLNFVILVLILYGWLWDPMLQMLDKRRAMIRERLDGAAATREEAGGLRRQRQRELGQLRGERAGIIEQATSMGEQERERVVERAHREAEGIALETRERLKEEARRARMALREEVAELATRIAAQVLKRELSRQDHDRLIEEMAERMSLGEGPPAAGEPQ